MKQYNADSKAEEGGLEVTIGGKIFIAREPTLAVMKRLAQAVPDTKPEDEEKKSERERMEEGIESIYPQLEVLVKAKEAFEYLREVEDPETGDKKPEKVEVIAGQAPPQDFVEEHLSMRRAGEMIATLMGDAEAEPGKD